MKQLKQWLEQEHTKKWIIEFDNLIGQAWDYRFAEELAQGEQLLDNLHTVILRVDEWEGELNPEIVGDGGIFPSPDQNTLRSLDSLWGKLGIVRVVLSDNTSRDRERLLTSTMRKWSRRRVEIIPIAAWNGLRSSLD